jgi:hypothetical protein
MRGERRGKRSKEVKKIKYRKKITTRERLAQDPLMYYVKQ